MISQYFDPAQVSAGLRQDIITCWIMVSNAGGAVGFPFPPVDASIVAPVADDLIAGLSPDRSRLIVGGDPRRMTLSAAGARMDPGHPAEVL
jgi:hypothetical protein